MILEARDASSFAEIFSAVSGSCDAGRTALFPDLCGRVFADRERLYRIFALIEFASAYRYERTFNPERKDTPWGKLGTNEPPAVDAQALTGPR
jgi:hypothetical protein